MPEPRDAILITRPEPGAADTSRRVAALGFVPIVAPVLTVETLAADLPEAAGLRAILATSGNAVAAIPPGWRGLPLLAVGDATASRARHAGFSEVHSADGDADALASLVERRYPPAGPPLLLASGAGQGEALAAALAGRGFGVIRREIYAARPVGTLPEEARAALAGSALRAALFFSAETARVFVRLVREAAMTRRVDGIEALAIGRPAGMALSDLPWRAIRIAARPTLDEMLALVR